MEVTAPQATIVAEARSIDILVSRIDHVQYLTCTLTSVEISFTGLDTRPAVTKGLFHSLFLTVSEVDTNLDGGFVTCQYRSATVYRFDEEQTDAIIRTVAYHRKDYPLSMIWFSPRDHADIRVSIATPFPRTSNEGSGSLDQLPLELLLDILLRLDMLSLFKLRQANLRLRQAVDSLKKYQMVVSHGLNLFRALLRTRLAIYISLLDFYDALCTKACTLCGEFGGFGAPETQVQSLASARRLFQLTGAEINQLRSFKTFPGIYAMDELEYKYRITVVSRHQAMLIASRRAPAPAQAHRKGYERNIPYNFMASCALPYYDQLSGKVEHGMSCAGCQYAIESEIYGSTAVLDRPFNARDKVFAQDGFLEHFRWCEQAQLLWKSSGEGKNNPAELPMAARRGGFFKTRE
ncbi:hypothetical protein BCR34DRAFT_634417 [Clohesyomyces aquaticus]|uniref:F-box domain-containing protein n=1 Tax=Clohesyomyces aquaticus TaxID=1231657 RepID=A0A1Y2A3M2_9PLEO|nr:hypothetical protein BCR34DRAFT_634417 [Clohesyomyces aquaticus]